VRRVDGVQQHVRRHRLLQRCTERCDEVVGQLADEADGVGDQRLHAGLQLDDARGGIQRGEEPVLDEELRSRQRAQDGGLAGVGVADEGGGELVGAALPLRGAAPGHDLELLAQVADAAADEAAVRLELRLARATEADTAADPRQVRPHALQSWQHVLELRQLHLHLRLAAAGARGEDVEDQLGAVHDARLQRVLQVLALRRRQFLVEDDEGRAQLRGQLPQFGDLALADVVLRVRRVEPLLQRAHHLRAGRVRQPLQLLQVLVRLGERRRLQRCSHQYDALDWILRLEYGSAPVA
jgi:hypothetical protein